MDIFSCHHWWWWEPQYEITIIISGSKQNIEPGNCLLHWLTYLSYTRGWWIHEDLVSKGPSSFQPWISLGGLYVISQQRNTAWVILQQRPAWSRGARGTKTSAAQQCPRVKTVLAGPENFDSYTRPSACRYEEDHRTVSCGFCGSSGSQSYGCSLCRNEVLSTSLSPEASGTAPLVCVCGHHTFPLLEDTLSTLMSSLSMSYPFT